MASLCFRPQEETQAEEDLQQITVQVEPACSGDRGPQGGGCRRVSGPHSRLTSSWSQVLLWSHWPSRACSQLAEGGLGKVVHELGWDWGFQLGSERESWG